MAKSSPRSWLFSDYPLALAALLISFTIWIMAKMSTLETEQLSIPILVDNVPENVKLDYTPKTASITIKFPQSQRARVVPSNFDVRFDAKEFLGDDPRATAGVAVPITHAVNLTLDNVHSANLPHSVRVTDVGPQTRVRVDATLYTQTLPIKVETTGTLPVNYVLSPEIRSEPAKTLVTASPDVLKKWTQPDARIMTEKIGLNDHREDFIVYADLILPKDLKLVDENQKKAQVIVGVKEKEITRTVEQVPFKIFVFSENMVAKFQPAVAQVKVKGRISIVDRVSPDMFAFTPKDTLAEELGVRKSIGLSIAFADDAPDEIRQEVTIEGFTPTQADIEFTRPDKTKPKTTKEQ